MEYHCTPLSWEFYNQEEGLEDLKHSLLCTNLELEATIASAKEEITRRECELIQVNDLLSSVMKERDEAQAQCQKLMLEKLELQQKQQRETTTTTTTISHNEDEIQGGISEKLSTHAASSDCEENSMNTSTEPFQLALELAEKKPLPEKGKLLKAVIEAGPLLQTLLLAGPLPQWQHPPPQLNSIEIPPVEISSPTQKNFSFINNKRDLVLSLGEEYPISSKYRRVIQHLTTTPTTTSTHSLPYPSFS
ncbi:hypothetical protein TanjilG_01689 [Lupinus angustifolius]|uniref:uncharacterized protein LOC109335639 n=1 Tax=Lupinus angustifolius TaxID=3871 RepID=UPI00090E8069|nr:PREDICTED: uncharacterized protein LOC109335639 [Lupinus angustifolius]OIV90608.1 hypothetical protein TanjilG_01689 [Lupinus angustifolius]